VRVKSDSSLGRFLRSQGTGWFAPEYNQYNYRAQLTIAWVMIGLGLLAILIALISGNYPVSAGAIGPMLAGVINLVVAFSMRKRAELLPGAPDSLNEDGRALLRNLILATDLGRRPPLNVIHPNRHSIGRQSANFTERIRILQPTEAVIDRLEPVLFQYNRLLGAITTLSDMGGDRAALAKRLRPAAEDAVAEALNTAAGLAEYPESAERSLAAFSRLDQGLKEMADRSEALTTETAPLPGGSSRPFDRALEELRLAERSQKELEEVLEQNA